MVRKQVYIGEHQQRTLKKLARETGKTEAEIIRNALDEHARLIKEKQDRMAAWRAIEATVEKRTKRHASGAGQTGRREEPYDRDERARSH